MEKKYWKSLEEQANLPVTNPGQKDEDASRSLLDLIDEEIDSKPSSRRNFLKFCGFSFATAALQQVAKTRSIRQYPILISRKKLPLVWQTITHQLILMVRTTTEFW